MAVLAPFLVLCTCVWGFHQMEATADNLCLQESSFSRGGLKVIYPRLEIKKCVEVPQNLRKMITTEWDTPKIIFPGANKLAEQGSIAKAALCEQRLDISLILIPSRVHTKAKKYVLVMVDPDAPSRAKQTSAYWRHWLVADLKGKALQDGEIDGTTLTAYHPPSPPRRSGFHRYQFMVFEQPPNTQVSLPQEQISSRGKWDLQAFTSRVGLGEPVATQVFLTQNFND